MGSQRKPRTIKIRKYLKDQLREKYEKGHGHPKEKDIHNATPYIHSNATYKTYVSQINHFADWLDTKGIKDKDEAFKCVKEYLEYQESQGKSAWTIYTSLCALSKAYGVPTDQFGYKPPKRERSAIKRSRYTSIRDKNFSEENNQDLITFCSCTGLRRSELSVLHGNDIAYDQDGNVCIHVKQGKGGKERYVKVIGSPHEQEQVLKMLKKADKGLVFSHIPSHFEPHYYRSVYACQFYKSIAREIETIPENEKYICRKDKAGIVYDRKAMKVVSQNLGHNRVEVISNNYLWNL